MAKFCSLFSSSSGNCTYLGSGGTGILIDAGVSAKKIKTALSARDIDPASLSAIFVTHSHSDHVSGLRVLASGYGIPVYATPGTLTELEAAGILNGKFPVYAIEPDGIEVGGVSVSPFPIPHDTAQPCGYTVRFADERSAAVATDIGHMTDEIMEAICGCDLVMPESNHDVRMLQNGPYPYALKQRILSSTGHLSNESCAEAVCRLVRSGTTRLFLGHLSAENNLPYLAYETTHSALTMMGATADRDYILDVNKKENDRGVVVF